MSGRGERTINNGRERGGHAGGIASRSAATPIERIRAICLAFPEVAERLSHGTPTFFVRDKKAFVYAWIGGHHDNELPHLWCAAAPGVQQELIATGPERFFRPPYVGHRGWVGVRLDGAVDWAEVAEVCEDAYRLIAPKRLVAELDK